MTNYRCVVFWDGFPACGHMLRALSEHFGKGLKVFATPSAVPFKGLGNFLINGISYISSTEELWTHFYDIKTSDIFIHTGWRYSDINKIDRRLKLEKAPTKILVMVDNRLKYSLRQFLGALYFRIYLRNLYDGYIVAGKSAFNLMKFFGIQKKIISSGHYGAASDLYPRWNGTKKFNQFVFVGSIEKRKGADLLAEAWRLYIKKGGTWSLKIFGAGPQENKFATLHKVKIHGFQQPGIVSKALLSSYAFILPGRDDNWGTVLAEAAASGCILVTTKFVGASEDMIVKNKNGFILTKLTPQEICDYLIYVSNLQKRQLLAMCEESTKISKDFDEKRMFLAIKSLIKLKHR
jgi:glycosyltransferase involved in cell wall biosynthesis